MIMQIGGRKRNASAMSEETPRIMQLEVQNFVALRNGTCNRMMLDVMACNESCNLSWNNAWNGAGCNSM
jgi:hypothetical protein